MKEFIKLEDPRKHYNGLHNAELEPKDIVTGGGVTVLGKGDLSLQSVDVSGQYSGAFGIVMQVQKKQKSTENLACKYIVSTLFACLFCLPICVFSSCRDRLQSHHSIATAASGSAGVTGSAGWLTGWSDWLE